MLDEDSENVMPPTNGYESAHVKDAPIEVDKVESCVEQVKSSVNEEQPKETVSNGGRKRKRTMKTVMKQFQDEEGFLGKWVQCLGCACLLFFFFFCFTQRTSF